MKIRKPRMSRAGLEVPGGAAVFYAGTWAPEGQGITAAVQEAKNTHTAGELQYTVTSSLGYGAWLVRRV